MEIGISGYSADRRGVGTTAPILTTTNDGAFAMADAEPATDLLGWEGPKSKRCNQCGVWRPLTDFDPSRTGKYGRQAKCSNCRRLRRRNRYALNPVKWSYKHIKATYGLSKAEFDQLLLSQNGRCAACDDLFGNTRHRHIDHCHTTGRIRGILCQSCNVSIGSMKEDIGRLRRLIAYLERQAEAGNTP